MTVKYQKVSLIKRYRLGGFWLLPEIVLPAGRADLNTKQQIFADGITEDIIMNLSELAELKVVPRNSTFARKGHSVDCKRISSDLDVPFIVEGILPVSVDANGSK